MTTTESYQGRERLEGKPTVFRAVSCSPCARTAMLPEDHGEIPLRTCAALSLRLPGASLIRTLIRARRCSRKSRRFEAASWHRQSAGERWRRATISPGPAPPSTRRYTMPRGVKGVDQRVGKGVDQPLDHGGADLTYAACAPPRLLTRFLAELCHQRSALSRPHGRPNYLICRVFLGGFCTVCWVWSRVVWPVFGVSLSRGGLFSRAGSRVLRGRLVGLLGFRLRLSRVSVRVWGPVAVRVFSRGFGCGSRVFVGRFLCAVGVSLLCLRCVFGAVFFRLPCLCPVSLCGVSLSVCCVFVVFGIWLLPGVVGAVRLRAVRLAAVGLVLASSMVSVRVLSAGAGGVGDRRTGAGGPLRAATPSGGRGSSGPPSFLGLWWRGAGGGGEPRLRCRPKSCFAGA